MMNYRICNARLINAKTYSAHPFATILFALSPRPFLMWRKVELHDDLGEAVGAFSFFFTIL